MSGIYKPKMGGYKQPASKRMAPKAVDWSKAPRVGTQARTDWYKKNNLKLDDTTPQPKGDSAVQSDNFRNSAEDTFSGMTRLPEQDNSSIITGNSFIDGASTNKEANVDAVQPTTKSEKSLQEAADEYASQFSGQPQTVGGMIGLIGRDIVKKREASAPARKEKKLDKAGDKMIAKSRREKERVAKKGYGGFSSMKDVRQAKRQERRGLRRSKKL